ncbi:ABC-2 family transporter protein [Candidatus Gracilibacteria bacterium]|nr:ABC-2 family transporter protein [Candidatus Gracilibacteria bacterium]
MARLNNIFIAAQKIGSALRLHTQLSLAYRGTILFWMLIHAIGFIAMFYFWDAVYSDRDIVGGFARSDMISYILIASMLREFVVVEPEYEINNDINQGGLARYLTRPFSYPLQIILSSSLWHSIEMIISLIVYTSLSYFLVPTAHWQLSWAVIVLVILGHICCSFLSLLLSTMAFWLQQASAFFYYKALLIIFTSGLFFPISTVPTWLQQVMQTLPFYNAIGLPAALMIEQASQTDILPAMSTLVIWTITLAITATFCWRKGLKRFEAIGG